MKIRTRLVLSALAVSSLVVAGGSTLATTPDATPAAMTGMSGTPAAGMDMHQQAMTGTGAAYLTIENAGSEPDRLVGASSPAAKSVEIHEMVDDGGTMRMRPLADGLAIPANATTALEPGGYHIMLIGLVEDLTEGDIYDLTLTFERAGDVTVQVPVGSGAPSGPVRVVAGVDDVVVEVVDDGRGIPPDAQAGVGLVSLRERASELGGTASVRCPDGGGTVVTARLPVGSDDGRTA